jgi:uncharacterized protein YjbJ (UPF0337 family)
MLDEPKPSSKDAADKVRERSGMVIGSNDPQFKGIQKQAEGSTQNAGGDLKAVLKDITPK